MAKLVPSRVIDGTARLVETYGQDPELICQRIGLILKRFTTRIS